MYYSRYYSSVKKVSVWPTTSTVARVYNFISGNAGNSLALVSMLLVGCLK